ncbi:MAG: HD domain-containing protein [Oscillospiraceae bacterium]|nr:HD domain-containing protein [Oscillospiraceae bacterium]
MKLPQSVTNCIAALEQAGFEAWCVGGCVRDYLLGLAPQDFDLCTDATPEEMHRVFAPYPLVTAGEKHGTVGVIFGKEVVEITTYRCDGAYSDSRHPDQVTFVRSLKEDLARRDFTVNAMAYSPSQGLRDPFGGQADLAKGLLRAVGNAAARFQEDALRILRGMRFAAKLGLRVEKATFQAMLQEKGRLDSLARERVFSELTKLLLAAKAEDLLQFSPMIVQVIPELEVAMGFDQHSPHHAYDIYTHICHVVEASPKETVLRWAALLHDVGKAATYAPDETGRGHFYGHAKVGAAMAEEILLRLKAPTDLRTQVCQLISRHMTLLEPDKKLLRRRLSQYGVEGVQNLLALQKADFGSKGVIGDDPDPGFGEIARLIEELLAEDACLSLKDLAVTGSDLMALGFRPGKALGDCLNKLLAAVLDEQAPNEKEALLALAQKELQAVGL